MVDSELRLSSALACAIENAAEMPAYIETGGILSWREAGERIRRLAAGLYELGVRPGARVVIVARTAFRAEEIKWAVLWLGGVAVPANWRYSPAELKLVLDDCRPFLVVADEPSAPLVGQVVPHFLLLGKDTDGLIAQCLPREPEPCDERSDAMIFYTGGTTGRSKGVRLSHRNIYLNALQIAASLRPLRSDVCLHMTPSFHTVSLLATCYFMRGASHVFLPAFDPAQVLEIIERHRVTVTASVPTMLVRMVGDPSFARRDLSSLRRVLFGGAGFTEAWVARLVRQLPGVEFIHGYGLTETSPNISMLEGELLREWTAGHRDAEILGSCGKPNLGISVRIADSQGRQLPLGEAGEVLLRGPNVMQGYLNRPEETAGAFLEGWLRTGDVGKMDREGNLYVLDRIKDMIITGGENVYSAEVETALGAHPAVLECAVFGIADEVYGESVAAAVILRPGAPSDASALVEHCRRQIARYKAPRLIEFVADLPRTPIGKVDKNVLRDAFSRKNHDS
jgi:long-chain acyl-CoA synthetase